MLIEWRELQFMDPCDLPKLPEGQRDIASFWGAVSNMSNPDGKRFPIISKLTQALLSLPHSNAVVERIFSQVTLIKTQKRNSLRTSTMDALLMVKQHLPCSCVEYNPDTSLCKCINVDMYDSQSSDDD